MSGLPPRARFFVGAVTALGLALAALQLPGVADWRGRDALAALALAAATVVAQRFLLPLPHRTETESFAMVEAVWVAALLLVRPSVFVLGAAAGVLFGQALFVRTPVKVAFNVAQDVIGLSLGLALFQALAAEPSQPRTWAAAAAAMAVYYLVNAVSVSLVIALVEGERFGSVFLPPLGPDSLHWATNVALGTLVAVMWLEVPEALPLLVAPLVLAFFAYRGWVRSMRERDRMQELARTADEISEQNDLEKRIAGGSGGDVDALADTLNRMLDRLERSYRQERRFISEASHELRTPITICRGHLEVLGPDPDPQELRDTLQVVLDELDRMGRILGDLTTLARVADPSFVRPEPVPLESFLQSVAAKAVPLLDGRLRVAPVPAGSSVRADPQRLTQALLNLLHNSARHGRGDAPVRLRTRAENGGWRIEVADSGGGLPPGTAADEVFRPFTRAAGGPGSGLGLAIVRRIAEAHGGAAGLENRPGDGVTVWIRLPG